MKAPYNWLKDLVDLKATAKEAAARLSLCGIECSADSSGILEADILPNRGDCHSIIGIARELCAVFNTSLKLDLPNLAESSSLVSSFASVEVKDADLCPRYMARVVTGLHVKPSPDWLQKRLIESGMRPINNIVDATNYIMLETGQPMHAFDLDRLDNKKIIVRRAKNGEKLTTLDDAQRTLSDKDLLICDGEKPVAVAGVMGGKSSEVSAVTKSILLESAYFEPTAVNKTSKRLKLRTESSARFEKGVDWNGVSSYLDRAAALIAELSGGQVAKGSIDIMSGPRTPKKINLRLDRIKKVLGIEIPKLEAVLILERLGFGVADRVDSLEVTVPLFRAGDIEREIDLIEETARIYGYDKVPETVRTIAASKKNELEVLYERKNACESGVRQVLLSCGFNEAKTFSMVGEKLCKKALMPIEGAVEIDNPLVEEMTHLRSSLLPGLLEAAEFNFNRQEQDIALFEIGRVFKKTSGVPQETNKIAALLTGGVWKGLEGGDRFEQDLSFLKGAVENIFDSAQIEGASFEPSADPHSEPGTSADIFVRGKKIGFLSQVSSAICGSFGLSKPVYVFELDLEQFPETEKKTAVYVQPPKYPLVRRDIAMFVPAGVTHKTIVETIKQSGGPLVEATDIFDRFESKGKKSLAYFVLYRSRERTLTDEEVNRAHNNVMEALESKLKVQIRK